MSGEDNKTGREKRGEERLGKGKGGEREREKRTRPGSNWGNMKVI